MESTIKDQVETNNKALKEAVDKQKATAAKAKANSNKPETKTAKTEGTGMTEDEHWTANMPEGGASFIAKKIIQSKKK